MQSYEPDASSATPLRVPSVDVNPRVAADFLRSRRSPKLRSLVGPAPSERELHDMLEIASRVPDHGKLVPWRFIAIRDDRRFELSSLIKSRFDALFPEASTERSAAMGERLTQAPVVITVVSSPKPHPRVSEWDQVLCAGAVCMSLLNGARALGFGAIWLTEWYATDPHVRCELGLSDDERVAGFVHVGRPTEPRDERQRPRVADLVTEY